MSTDALVGKMRAEFNDRQVEKAQDDLRYEVYKILNMIVEIDKQVEQHEHQIAELKKTKTEYLGKLNSLELKDVKPV